ncbi:Ubiquitin carboxyl-terminal hydrolase like isoform 1 [Actinidia chinensis var. chinensis]|uniref:Ubiquitin carboxyl-terminal hydrolase like isoform 1 n=1 Tax=Actinidia chinensis var. chinensis TaxID=1590841 RepID=A0A2R6QNH1_ACTCC|nr:Ubiquitin carboxyl-terminal hydrolase like isoform 1 [Actinidia chinensis var. chinensis]
MASSEDRRGEPEKEMLHKTKLIQFLGRTTPIVLQNDNGPCPLLAICNPLLSLLGNVLLLKNNLNLSSDITEVSQEKLLALVAERLIDSNSNVNNRDAGYVENQQQNIGDAIDLLPRLATGIDVNIKFKRIDDFEFTRECAIFDLLDIPLCHGWIVDTQDYDLANAIGSKSYNTIVEELVALETNMESEQKKNSEEDFIDFAAATTATLGVPSPCLSRGRSFDDSLRAVSDHHKLKKGDLEEEAELLRVLKLSEAALTSEMQNTSDLSVSHDSRTLSIFRHEVIIHEAVPKQAVCSETDQANHIIQSACEGVGKCVISKDVVDESSVNVSVQIENALPDSSGQEIASACENLMHESRGDETVQQQSASTSDLQRPEDNNCTPEISSLSSPGANSDLSSGRRQQIDVLDAFTSSADSNEPIYEGEECILESEMTKYEDREPMYEGEVALAEQVDKSTGDSYDASSKDEISPRQGELIRNFLKNSASQLTIYGLFCLQDGLKERELCVFFRNNHFNTMFKFDGELYILATDQGYLNQPDLVWEKLNEVNGDTLFMTGDFKEFKVESHASNPWDEQNAMASTVDYLASIDNSAHENSSFSSDMQLAIALQQQEFEQQPQQSQRNVQQATVSDSSRLVTGPQVSSRSSGRSFLSSKQEPKSSKEKCIVM